MKIKKNKRISFKKNLFEAFEYIKESRNYIYSVIIVFFLSLILGFILRGYLGFIGKYLTQIVSEADNLNLIGLISYIMLNNIKTAFFGLFLGIFFGILSFSYTVINGGIVGYVIGLVVAKSNIFELWTLLPHGIFELAALFISLGLGLKLGMFIFTKKPIKTLHERFLLSMNVFIFVVVPLLVIAAIIEGSLIFLLK